MAVPVANFTFLPTGLSIQFTDLSENIPTSWSWDFGDGSPLVTIQSPAHVYAAAGIYVVRLTATNGDGSHQVIVTINVSTTPVLQLAIRDIVRFKIPAAIPLNQVELSNYISKWQLYLQILIDPNITNVNVFVESAWPPLVNFLIAELVAYEIILQIGQQASTSNSITSTTSTPASLGSLKKIKTGPAEAEYYDGAGTIADVLKNVFKPGGLFILLKDQICMNAARLRITLPMCSPLVHGPVIPKKQGRPPTTNPETFFVVSSG